MNFLIDENLPVGLSIMAQQNGHHAKSVRDIQAGASDQDIFKNILKKDQTLVTRDKRFANYVLYQMMIEKCAEGVVLIREEKLVRILQLWESYLLLPPAASSFVILSQNKIRIRKII